MFGSPALFTVNEYDAQPCLWKADTPRHAVHFQQEKRLAAKWQKYFSQNERYEMLVWPMIQRFCGSFLIHDFIPTLFETQVSTPLLNSLFIGMLQEF
jgi:hypothetical protein